MTIPVAVRARSYTDEAVYQATLDLVTACGHLPWRLVGGVAVHLQQHRWQVTDVPDRPTRDADAAIRVAVGRGRTREDVDADIAHLVDQLNAAGYRQQGRSNRFVTSTGDPERVIDLLTPGYRRTIQHNQPVGSAQLLTDAVPGLGYALGPDQPADEVELTVNHLDDTASTVSVPLATVPSLLTIKAIAWRGRHSPRDALDIWRLLEITQRGTDLLPDTWPTSGSAGHARAILHTDERSIARAAASTPRDRARVRALLRTFP